MRTVYLKISIYAEKISTVKMCDISDAVLLMFSRIGYFGVYVDFMQNELLC